MSLGSGASYILPVSQCQLLLPGAHLLLSLGHTAMPGKTIQASTKLMLTQVGDFRLSLVPRETLPHCEEGSKVLQLQGP